MSMDTTLYHKTRKSPKATLVLVKNTQCQPEEMGIDNTEASCNGWKNIKYVFFSFKSGTEEHKQKSLDIFRRCYRVSIILKTAKQRGRIKHLPAFPLGTINQVNQIDNEGNSLSTKGTQVVKREMIEQDYHDFANTY